MRIRHAAVTDAAGIAKVHVDSWRTTYEGLVPADFLAAMSYEVYENRWRYRLQNKAVRYAMFVAEEADGRIVGFADGGPERTGDAEFRGELYALYLLKTSQRKGIGTQLFHAIAAHLIAQGYGSMLIWVLKANPSRSFYEALGGVKRREATIEVGGSMVEEAGYGWSDLNGWMSGHAARLRTDDV
ncbi:GNAT superfamily N-acetyltransferase [Paenibacillus phyllosphaerae]|uniref:GNAT superfamily N-acetyltransferase n=1 Tax=Paenibacillus phyllosphaerae TaxID=274593 RepID=A0A7W5AYJ8_9BACL|nr:GNAT family N-acetyltransferase [Paenibacillus phyllosphaerae]MBB3111138.1 GNAT superfamily N-acetyltransferase [Paenibacillus phyllosphaerae]